MTNNRPPRQWFSPWGIALTGLWLSGLTVVYYFVIANAVRQYLTKFPTAYVPLVALAGLCVLASLVLAHWRWPRWTVTLYWLGGLSLLALVLSLTTRQFIAVLIALWLSLLAYVWGATFTRRCTPERLTGAQAELFCLNVSLGLSWLAGVTLVLGFTHLLRPRWIWTAMIVLTLVQTRALIRLGQTWWSLQPAWRAWRKTAFAFPEQGILAVILAMLVLCNFSLALLPETRFEALNYQLAVPRMYLEQGHFVDLPSFWHSYFARFVNLLFTLALGLHGPAVARLIVFVTGLATLAGVVAITRRLGDERAVWWAAVLFYATPLISWLGITAYVDLPLTMFLTASLLAFLLWREQYTAGWLAGSGLLAGAALATKPTGAFGLILMPLLIVVWLGKSATPQLAQRLRQVTGYAGCLLLVATPLYLYTYWLTGNPVFPFYNGIFKSPGWPAVNTMFNADQFGVTNAWLSLLRLPFAFVFQSKLFDESNPPGSYGLFLLLSPLAYWLYQTKAKLATLLLAQCGIFLWLWANSFQYGRYYTPVHPLLVALTIAGLWSMALPPRLAHARLFFLSSWLLAQGLLIPFANGDLFLRLPYRYWLGKESAEAFLIRSLKGYAAVPYLNQHVQSPGRIASADTEYLRFYVNAPLDTNIETRDWESLLRITEDEPLAQELYRRGYRYLWLGAPDVFSRQPWLRFMRPEFLARYATLEFSNEQTQVFRLHPTLP